LRLHLRGKDKVVGERGQWRSQVSYACIDDPPSGIRSKIPRPVKEDSLKADTAHHLRRLT
jgi:hypothetical protein